MSTSTEPFIGATLLTGYDNNSLCGYSAGGGLGRENEELRSKLFPLTRDAREQLETSARQLSLFQASSSSSMTSLRPNCSLLFLAMYFFAKEI